MTLHYKGVLGDFDYDSNTWRVDNDPSGDSIHWIGGDTACVTPKGLTSYKGMFENCTLGKGFTFNPTDSANVTNTSYMFHRCTIKSDFIILGEGFDTSNVKFADFMFAEAQLPANFRIKNLFSIGMVKSLEGLFFNCHLGDTDITDLGIVGGVQLLNSDCDSSSSNRSYDFTKLQKLSIEILRNCLTKEDIWALVTDSPMNPPRTEDTVICDFGRLLDVPSASLRNCKTKEDLFELLDRFCRV